MALEGRNLSFRYGESWLLKNEELRIEAGEIVGLVGPSGSGKSTLARLLAGHERLQEGSVVVNGSSLPARGRNPVQMVVQHPEQAVNPRWRLRRTLLEGGTPDESLLIGLGIEPEWLDRFPNELSGGELQRICVARALGPGTRYLIADEMTTMLDAITQAQIWQTVLGWAARRGAGILVISHERQLIRRLCSRVVERGARL